MFTVLREAFQPEPALDGLEERLGAPLPLAHPREVCCGDGQRVESSKLNTLSPDAIESIEVIKGEAAKALYGDAGVNGVIKVTTKKK